MEMRYKYLFTLCLLVGFQVQVPVTMFPANSEMDETAKLLAAGVIDRDPLDGVARNQISDLARGHVRETNLRSRNGLITSDFNKQVAGELAKNMKQKNAHVDEYLIQGSHTDEHEKYDTVIDSHTGEQLEHLNLNGEINQVNRVDLHDFNNRKSLKGLDPALGANHIKSFKSVLSRLPKDLRLGNKLEQIHERLINISNNLSGKKNSIRRDRDRPISNTGQTSKEDNIAKIVDTVDILDPDNPYERKHTHNGTESKHTGGSVKHSNRNVNDIVWSADIENACPGGYTDADQSKWKQKVESKRIVNIEAGCGSMQNRLITFNDSSKACVRYRMNDDLMQGDIYSFYLGTLLGMHYTPPTTMYKVSESKQWSLVREHIITSKWSEHKPLIITKWAEDLKPVYMPPELKDNKRKLHPENYRFQRRPVDELCELVQWTDLIVFDYISANLDRVVNNMFNLKWNHKMLEKPIHNLEKSKSSGRFVFLDNESGLFHGYRLLDSYSTYHESLLESVCTFRKSTVDAVEMLYKGGQTGQLLQSVYEDNEQLHGFLPRMSKKTMQTLQNRVGDVYKHMQLCKNQFSERVTH